MEDCNCFQIRIILQYARLLWILAILFCFEASFEISHLSNPNVLKEIIWIEKAGESVLEKSSEIYAKA
jgi:hypothetical protein